MSEEVKAEKVVRSYFNFRTKNPIDHFTEIFKKQIDQQWSISKAHFLNLILQTLNLGCLVLTQKFITIRMEFEENEYRRALWAIMIHLICWVYLCYLRRKKFTIPPMLGFLTFNLFALTHLYLSAYSLCANTLGDPNTKIIYTTLTFCDCLFSFLYVFLNDFIYTSGYLGFTFFPKIFFAICFYFYFDDRLNQILIAMLVTTVQAFFTGLQSQELLLNVYREKVLEFRLMDYYSLMYLDLPYIAKMCFCGTYDMVLDFKDWITGTKTKYVEEGDGENADQDNGDADAGDKKKKD